MLHGDDAYLMSAMSQYGYSLLQPDRMVDPNELLAALSQSTDVRVLEGFPVVLATALKKRRDAVNLETAESALKDAVARERFEKLAALSFYLFGVFGFEDLKPKDYNARLERANLLNEMRSSVERNLPLSVGNKTVDVGRLKRTFLNYFVHGREVESSESKASLREDFQREYHLSLFFAPKQRDLLQKKLRGETLTKTEREYFSRVVKKKLLALADPDLHRLAQKALQ